MFFYMSLLIIDLEGTPVSILGIFFHQQISITFHVTTLSLGSRPRQSLQGCGPRGSLGITSHAPGSAKECEGVNPHTPK